MLNYRLAADAAAEPWQRYQAIYVHIPFCVQKCLYCDFASYAGYQDAQKQEYVQAVAQELAARREEAQYLDEAASIYFGGGTPSTLPTECLAQLVEALKANGFWRRPREATIEVNPGTADLAKLQALRALGFDRISFGVQSLQCSELRTIGRIHTAQQALEAVALAREAGFRRINADLIYGLPGQTLASLRDTLERLTATGIEHLSVYGLIVEEGTPLEKLVDSGRLQLPDEDEAADMYELVQNFLHEAGFARYEISNYAKLEQQSQHNIVYWQYHPYLGFGAAACGFDGGVRRTAAESVQAYVEQAGRLTPENWRTSSLYTVEKLDASLQLEEFMFMGLRRSTGAQLAEARTRFGVDVLQRFGKDLQRFIDGGFVEYDAQSEVLRLTEKGMAVGNQIFDVFVIN